MMKTSVMFLEKIWIVDDNIACRAIKKYPAKIKF
ncbi:MAG: hypothetical protein ACD_15C00113G0009 [uncultured bacterium]|nr:MAG: hypothetical protein ACD_15C00113G0009 [uncultured bacterium]